MPIRIGEGFIRLEIAVTELLESGRDHSDPVVAALCDELR